MSKEVCGAKLRKKDSFCQSTVLCDNGRCRNHGGKTPKGIASPNFKDGKHSKYQYLPPNFSARLETVTGDHIENLEKSIEIQKVLESRFLEKLESTESTEAWKKLAQAVRDYSKAEFEASNDAEKALARAQAFGMIKFLVEEGLNQSFLFRDIQNIQETQRKLSETLSKVRKEAQEIYTHEQWNEMLATLANVLKNNVKDAATLNNIQSDLKKLSEQQNAKQLGNIG